MFLCRNPQALNAVFEVALSLQVLIPAGETFVFREIEREELGEIESPALVSGFADQLPAEVAPCCSPTLRLNADLGSFTREQQQKLALAEWERRRNTCLKSYLHRVAPRAAVVAADPVQLERFVETYGGVLELVPVLLAAEPAVVAGAEEAGIEAVGGEYRVRWTVRAPIDREKCSWCRACIAVCEPRCISPDLQIDFSRCSLCGQCVRACPEAAIDLYAREEKEFTVPAVILLGEPQVELPAAREMIFAAADLEAYFRRVREHQVVEAVAYDRGLCQYSGRLDQGCRRCLEACAVGAVTLGGDGVEIDHLACGGCGACVAACPTGALQAAEFNDRQFVAFFAGLSLSAAPQLVVGTEAELRHLWWLAAGRRWSRAFFLAYPQPGALTAMHFLFLFALGCRQVRVLTAGETAMTEAALREQRLANRIIAQLFGCSDFVVTGDVAAFSALPDQLPPPSLAGFYADFSYAGRRRKMASVLEFLVQAAEREAVPLVGDEFAAYGRVACDADRCTACAACLNECRSGALYTSEQEYTLQHRPVLCVQCGICVAVCPEQALSLVPGLVPAAEFFAAQVLARAEPMVCRRCGARFGTRKSYERVMSLLREQGRFAEIEDVLTYCETCRAVKMFEANES